MNGTDRRIMRIAELDIVPEHLDAYRALLREEIATSLAIEPGVLMLQAVSLRETPHQIRLLEVYADETAYQAHIQSPHFLKYKQGTSDMVRHLRLLDVDPVAVTTTV